MRVALCAVGRAAARPAAGGGRVVRKLVGVAGWLHFSEAPDMINPPPRAGLLRGVSGQVCSVLSVVSVPPHVCRDPCAVVELEG